MGKTRKALNSSEVESKTRGTNLESKPSLTLRLCSQLTTSGACIGAAINFPGKTKLFVEPENSCHTVGQYIILRKQISRCRKDGNPKITECVEATVLTKLLSHEHRSVRIRLVQSDPPCLI